MVNPGLTGLKGVGQANLGIDMAIHSYAALPGLGENGVVHREGDEVGDLDEVVT